MLSNSALYGYILQSGHLPVEDTTESLTLYNEALRLMNEELRDSEQDASDDVIGSMCGFLTHDVRCFAYIPGIIYADLSSSTSWGTLLVGTDTWMVYGR
jgi:hypothetical protein